MSISKLLKEQKDWLESATKNIDTRKVTKKDLEFPEVLKKKRQEDIKEKITNLKRQKNEAVKRYDLAIADQEKELVRIEKEISIKGLTEIKPGKTRKTPSKTNRVVKEKKTTPKKTKKTKTTKRKTSRRSSRLKVTKKTS